MNSSEISSTVKLRNSKDLNFRSAKFKKDPESFSLIPVVEPLSKNHLNLPKYKDNMETKDNDTKSKDNIALDNDPKSKDTQTHLTKDNLTTAPENDVETQTDSGRSSKTGSESGFSSYRYSSEFGLRKRARAWKRYRDVNRMRLVSGLLLRLCLFPVFYYTEHAAPFANRVIHPEDAYLYRHPRIHSYMTTPQLWYMCATVPTLLILGNFLFGLYQAKTKFKADRRKEKAAIRALYHEAATGVFCYTILFLVNGLITNALKLTIGRPRPDFFSRCWPQTDLHQVNYTQELSKFDAEGHQLIDCYGSTSELEQGRKSFPSGHSSFSFATLGFVLFFYLGKILKKIPTSTRFAYNSGFILLPLVILMLPTLAAVSRTCDYHHHWQDVTVGSLLGLVNAYAVYSLYFPGKKDNEEWTFTTALPYFYPSSLGLPSGLDEQVEDDGIEIKESEVMKIWKALAQSEAKLLEEETFEDSSRRGSSSSSTHEHNE